MPGQSFTIDEMRSYLYRSLSSLNKNKINGLLAEIDFRRHVQTLGFDARVSFGGWIVRSDSRGDFDFGQHTAVLFPEVIRPDHDYLLDRQLPEPSRGLHTICATFYQIGIRSYFCVPCVSSNNDQKQIQWKSTELGRPDIQPYTTFPDSIIGFNQRPKKYNFLRYHSDASGIPEYAVPEEFTKEALRVAFASRFYSEPSDVDGLFWGQEKTYPLEIKEKTRAHDKTIGDFFGIDVGPFVKLSYYAAKRGNLHSIFIVREIDDVNTRQLVKWHYITFEKMAQYASWVFRPGGRGMTGGRSATIRIPVKQFDTLNAENLSRL